MSRPPRWDQGSTIALAYCGMMMARKASIFCRDGGQGCRSADVLFKLCHGPGVDPVVNMSKKDLFVLAFSANCACRTARRVLSPALSFRGI